MYLGSLQNYSYRMWTKLAPFQTDTTCSLIDPAMLQKVMSIAINPSPSAVAKEIIIHRIIDHHISCTFLFKNYLTKLLRRREMAISPPTVSMKSLVEIKTTMA